MDEDEENPRARTVGGLKEMEGEEGGREDRGKDLQK